MVTSNAIEKDFMDNATLYQEIESRLYKVVVPCGDEKFEYSFEDIKKAFKFFSAMVRDEFTFAKY